MAEGDGAFYNNFKEQSWEGVFQLQTGGHSIKVTLHTGYTPDIDGHVGWSDVSATEYTSADGYTSNDKTLGSQDVTQDNTNNWGKWDAADVTWTSLGPLTPATPSHAILWDDDVAGDPLICYFELGTTATDGSDYTLQFGANGIAVLA
jgi:hypothetical protein